MTARPVLSPPPSDISAHTGVLPELSPAAAQKAQQCAAHTGWPWWSLTAHVQLEGPRAVIKQNPNKYILSVT